jgi:hypothetical protein
MTSDLAEFNRNLVQDVLATAEASDITLPDSYTQRMLEHLTEAGEVEDGLVCYHGARGIEISGYGRSDDGRTLDLFLSNFQNAASVTTMSGTDVQTSFKRLSNLVARCRDGYQADVSDASPAFDMVQDIEYALPAVTRLRMFVLTNATIRPAKHSRQVIEDIEYEYHVWDLNRLHRLLTSGTLHEPIVVDFSSQFSAGLRCLSTPATDEDYSVLLAIIPGDVLAALYDEYGPRLLELNVRSFLQTKGAVNRGIRESLVKTPERFLAYNNGISATASKVELSADGTSILRLHDLQVVNGGQTTASVHNAVKRDGADVSSVFVQAKITVVSPQKIGEIVPAISKYSNTQNKVTTADFSANDTFHVEVEKLSRSVWAPSAIGDGQETRWFYERARGQYADELARQRTPARQKAFRISHPTRQKFTKTDLAKFESTWDQLPHLVSRGAEKNFREYMARLAAKGRPRVDAAFFQRLVAKAILFRETERIVAAQKLGGYRANIVTFTLAKLNNSTQSRIDLDEIWRVQGLSAALTTSIEDLCVPVMDAITNPPRSANVGEWCKRPEAWAKVEGLAWSVPSDLAEELIDLRARRIADAQIAAASSGASNSEEVEKVSLVHEKTWFDCASWAKQTNRLAPWQRGLSFSLGQRAGRGEPPTEKQALQGLAIIREALRLGFQPAEPVDPRVVVDD